MAELSDDLLYPSEGTRFPTEDECNASLLWLTGRIEKVTAHLIGAELRQYIPVFEQNISRRAKELRDAEQALEKPRKALAEIAGKITAAEGKCSQISQQLAVDGPEERALTRMRFAEWDAELSSLTAARDAIEREITALEAARNDAQAKGEAAVGGLVDLAAAISNPFEHPLAQATVSYVRWRMPQTWKFLLLGERDHPEYPVAVDQLRELMRISGERIDFSAQDARAAKNFWDDYRQEHWGESEDNSGAAEVARIHGAMEVIGENKRLAGTPQPYPEDYRKIPQRAYMEVQRLRSVKT